MKQPNYLIHEASPYLLQHAHNPVNWYPWGETAFSKARQEDKPLFLSIGYSTCHWCHVMAHESFEDESVAKRLNEKFISIKVDREERPDIDGVYMRACQALTGSGGWPTSIFMDADGKPFYAGTYFPKNAFINLLDAVSKAWDQDRASLLDSGRKLTAALSEDVRRAVEADGAPIEEAVADFRRSFDDRYGGFGKAPKFPSPHNLMFLLYTAQDMAMKTLDCMHQGGICDHIGGGFSRYSTDQYWLVPHFEKMLYDNALLAMAYMLGYETTGKELYCKVAEQIFLYLERELHAPGGGFYSAQDADSEGVEGKFYLFTPAELTTLLGQTDGERFCHRFGITSAGNFEGGSIPNLMRSAESDKDVDELIAVVYDYRKRRVPPQTDTKQLTAWNALTAAAYAMAARVLKSGKHLNTARETVDFIENKLTDGTSLFVSITDGKRSDPGFLDDYAYYLFALIQMHQATLDSRYLTRAVELADRVWALFWDEQNGGFFFSGAENETLISRPKESWDGALPSGNSVMAYVLSRLALLTEEERFEQRESRQCRFMDNEAAAYPMGYSFYLWSTLPVKKVICTPADNTDLSARRIPSDWVFRVADSAAYPTVNGKTTYYVCENGTCRPPVNKL